MTDCRVISTEFRCNGRVQGILKTYPDGKQLLEVRCVDRRCADRREGEVVFHYFDIETGALDHNKRYRDPRRPKNTSDRREHGSHETE